MAASDLVSVRGQVMEYPYIPTGIKGEMVRSGTKPGQTGEFCICMMYQYKLRIMEIEEDLGIWALCPR